MSDSIDVKVPDIGDFTDVEIIEVLVSNGDAVKADDPLITLESDKATMEVPSPADGVLQEVTVKVGDRVSEGSLIARLERTGSESGPTAAGAGAPAEPAATPAEPAASGDLDKAAEPTAVKVPDIGDFTDVEIIEVLVAAGDEVAAEAPLITLESDKATMDVPSPAAGKIVELKVKVGDRVSEGSLVALLSPPQAAGEASPTAAAAPATPEPSAEEKSRAGDEDSVPMESVRRGPPPSLPPPVERAGAAIPHASPGVRRFARELGADLTLVRGSGPKGRILREDVTAYVKSRLSEAAPAQAAAAMSGTGIPPIPEVDFSKFGEIETRDVPRIKKISGAHLHRAWLNIPHVTHHDEADITELEAFRQKVNEEQARSKSPLKVTMLAFAMKAVAAALKAFPLFNASLTPDGQRLVYKKYCHVGIAVDTPNGLVVPVFRDVDGKGVLALAAEMAEVSTRARDGKLKPEEMQGGSISISSLGGIGGTAFTPIVNAPEVAIVGLTRHRMTPVWDGATFEPRLMLPLDLSYDHRVIDGAEAARFAAFLCRALADPRRLLL